MPEVTLKEARVRPRDIAWLAVAVGFSAAIAYTLATAVIDTSRTGDLPPVWELVVGAALYAVVGRWLVAGAWRRTLWGAPPGGVRDNVERRSDAGG